MRFFGFALVFVPFSAALAEPMKGLISLEDYPPEALARGEQGTVKAKLRISPAGQITGCTIMQSATQSLDAATCYVLMRRAKFKPATNEAGTPVEADYDATITWKLEDRKENPKNNSTRMQN